ncbi:uncharacterized protein V1518DRAFT_421004 [Limtongia smithiae]|uniref:uncharacterized protein n=1 Tax=Limtongia smithiae TaxID=1125753 RepID=UPI0034CDF966
MARGSASRRANQGNTSNASASSSTSSLIALGTQQQQQSGGAVDHGAMSSDSLRRSASNGFSPLHAGSSTASGLAATQQPATPTKANGAGMPDSTAGASTPQLSELAAQIDSTLDLASSHMQARQAALCSDPSGSQMASGTTSRSSLLYSSILPPHPLIDSVAIFTLIIQFPNVIVSFIHVLFACFTFVPRTNISSSSSSLLSSLTHATPTTPSLLTVLFTDILILVVSIFFLPRMRSVMVDLGSAVIASSLGGGGSKIALYCASFLQLTKAVRHSLFMIQRDALSSPMVAGPSAALIPDPLPSPPPQYYLVKSASSVPRTWNLLYGSAGWFTEVLAAHIVGQSLMHSLRRIFLEHDNKLSSMPAASSAPGLLGDGYSIDYEAANYQNLSPASSAVPSSSASGRKKKKSMQSAWHYQQTLWSALANTLVLASRESSQLHATSSVRAPTRTGTSHVESGQADDASPSLLSSLISDDFSSANGLAYRPSASEPALYSCVRYILENEVAFEITAAGPQSSASVPMPTGSHAENQDSSSLLVPLLFSHADSQSNGSNTQTSVYNGVTVRVNGILWPEVSVQTIIPKINHPANTGSASNEVDPIVQLLEMAVADDSAPSEDACGTESIATELLAETLLVVSGLTPITEYEIEISKTFKMGRQVVVCLTNVCTLPKDLSAVSSQLQQPSRPLSPVTTLLDTLCTTNATLTEEKQKFKRSRRDHSKQLSALRSEIDSLKVRLGSGDRGDERAWRRVLALRESVRRTEEEIEGLNSQLEGLTEEEVQAVEEFQSRRRDWKLFAAEMDAVEAEFSEASEQVKQRERALLLDEGAVISKRDKLQARQKKLILDFERADQERRMIWNEAFAKRKDSRERLARRRQGVEEEFSTAITKMERGADDLRERTSSTWQSIAAFGEAAMASAAAAVGVIPPPLSPIVSGSTISSSPLIPGTTTTLATPTLHVTGSPSMANIAAFDDRSAVAEFGAPI